MEAVRMACRQGGGARVSHHNSAVLEGFKDWRGVVLVVAVAEEEERILRTR